jgi:hypothetical protein
MKRKNTEIFRTGKKGSVKSKLDEKSTSSEFQEIPENFPPPIKAGKIMEESAEYSEPTRIINKKDG